MPGACSLKGRAGSIFYAEENPEIRATSGDGAAHAPSNQKGLSAWLAPNPTPALAGDPETEENLPRSLRVSEEQVGGWD